MPDVEDSHLAGARLFAATIAAHGGEEFLNVQSIKMTGAGEFTTPPQTGKLTVPITSFTFSVATGGRNRLEARGPGLSLAIVSRGHGKSGYAAFFGRTLPLPPDQTNYVEPTELLRLAYREKFPVIAASEEIYGTGKDGKPLLHYQILPEPDKVIDIFVEWPSRLIRKLVTVTSRGETTVLLSGYRIVEGLMMFGEVQVLENGENIYKLKASEITLNAPISDKLFE